MVKVQNLFYFSALLALSCISVVNLFHQVRQCVGQVQSLMGR